MCLRVGRGAGKRAPRQRCPRNPEARSPLALPPRPATHRVPGLRGTRAGPKQGVKASGWRSLPPPGRSHKSLGPCCCQGGCEAATLLGRAETCRERRHHCVGGSQKRERAMRRVCHLSDRSPARRSRTRTLPPPVCSCPRPSLPREAKLRILRVLCCTARIPSPNPHQPPRAGQVVQPHCCKPPPSSIQCFRGCRCRGLHV